MKKLFALFTLVAAVLAMTSCSGGPKVQGTPIDKAHFTIIQPEGWEVVANEDARVEIMHQGEKHQHQGRHRGLRQGNGILPESRWRIQAGGGNQC